MVLCENRPEGFGPKSAFSANLPTTCFSDVIVVPLATWVYLAVLLVAIPVILMHRSRMIPNGSEKSYQNFSKTRNILKTTLKVIYYLLIVAMLAMVSLELARLTVAELGIGLLPFTYVGILFACVLHAMVEPRLSRTSFGLIEASSPRQRWIIKATNGLYWILLLCVMAIKVAAEAKEQNIAGHRTGRQADYPLSDSITDNATMVGVEFVLFWLELFSI